MSIRNIDTDGRILERSWMPVKDRIWLYDAVSALRREVNNMNKKKNKHSPLLPEYPKHPKNWTWTQIIFSFKTFRELFMFNRNRRDLF
jgi:hypothetical protein